MSRPNKSYNLRVGQLVQERGQSYKDSHKTIQLDKFAVLY